MRNPQTELLAYQQNQVIPKEIRSKSTEKHGTPSNNFLLDIDKLVKTSAAATLFQQTSQSRGASQSRPGVQPLNMSQNTI